MDTNLHSRQKRGLEGAAYGGVLEQDGWALIYISSSFNTSWIPENASYIENQIRIENVLNDI